MKQLLAAILIAVPSVLFGQGQSTEIPVVTLEDALRLAEQNAPSMRTSRQNVRSANLTLTQRYAAFLPSISTNGSFSPAQNGADVRYGAGISASLGGLFNWNTYFAVSTAKRGRDVAEANAVQATYALRTQVKNQYFAVLQAQEALSTAERQLGVTQDQMEISRARVRAGTVVQQDSLRTLLSVLSAQNSVATAQNSIQSNIRTFSRTLGIESSVRPDAKDTANFQIIQIDSLALTAMLQDAPAAVSSRATIENQRSNLRTARLAYIPSPNGSISISRSGTGESFFGYTDKTYRYSGGRPSINFSFSLQVFNGFGREAQLINAREAVENAQYNYRDQQLTAESNLINQINAIRLLESQLKIQQQQLELANEDHRIARIRYELDLVTELDVTTARNALFNAQNTIINSRNSYRNAISALEALIGRDLR